MKTNWQIKKLGEVCEIKPPKKEARDRLNDDDIVSFVPMEDLGILTKNFIATKERPLKEVSGSYTYFSDNDVLLAKITPCFENGKIGIARNLKNGIGFGSSEYIIFRSRGEVIPDYLYYYLARDQFRQDGKKAMTGAVGHKRVPKDFIENQKIPYPNSLPEQQRVVAILEEAFAAIATAKEKTEKNLQNARELFASYLQSVFANPGDGWEEKTLGECFKLKSGDNITSKMMIENGKYPVYGGNGIAGMYNKFNLSGSNVIVGRVGALCGNVRHIEEAIWLTDNGFKITDCKYDFDNAFLAYLLNLKNLRNYARQAAQPVISNSSLEEVLLQFPKSLKDQKSIVTKLDALSAETKKLEAIYRQKLADLDELKKSVLQKAFTGQLTMEN